MVLMLSCKKKRLCGTSFMKVGPLRNRKLLKRKFIKQISKSKWRQIMIFGSWQTWHEMPNAKKKKRIKKTVEQNVYNIRICQKHT